MPFPDVLIQLGMDSPQGYTLYERKQYISELYFPEQRAKRQSEKNAREAEKAAAKLAFEEKREAERAAEKEQRRLEREHYNQERAAEKEKRAAEKELEKEQRRLQREQDRLDKEAKKEQDRLDAIAEAQRMKETFDRLQAEATAENITIKDLMLRSIRERWSEAWVWVDTASIEGKVKQAFGIKNLSKLWNALGLGSFSKESSGLVRDVVSIQLFPEQWEQSLSTGLSVSEIIEALMVRGYKDLADYVKWYGMDRILLRKNCPDVSVLQLAGKMHVPYKKEDGSFLSPYDIGNSVLNAIREVVNGISE